ncbi:RNA methyltransferase [Aestuariirhabdus litorea]|uniref:TrmH family RNA methyltransferase n=1 Tax=Aestuariirhabdus litorea TaxID=2528527 RepID=A0A3P3VQ74_9GAMM|nr:RNA methyltransferase [Aestuariirhabdus litorea]RRJ84098.1 TrmH family RNA methyltransferase [Aestuariirhabdus litorea]RWW97318.1 TrmH family RNA methyltransferase [Endozoicomonadaceae bacterium GTF-13]
MNKRADEWVGVGLINPKSPSNVGAVMRAAGCYGVDAVHYTGERYGRAARFHTDTKAAARRIPLTAVVSPLDALPADTALVCVELVEGATALPQYQHPGRALYLFGPEDGTIPQRLIDQADAVVYVPTRGCMNLAATVNVVLYDRLAKRGKTPADDGLILNSRDTNNRVRVKPRARAAEEG